MSVNVAVIGREPAKFGCCGTCLSNWQYLLQGFHCKIKPIGANAQPVGFGTGFAIQQGTIQNMFIDNLITGWAVSDCERIITMELSEKLPKGTIRNHASSVTLKGEKFNLIYAFDFSEVSVEQALHIASKDLSTDIQNQTRINGGDSSERGTAKADKMRAMIKEQKDTGSVAIKVASMNKHFVKTLTTTETIDLLNEEQLLAVQKQVTDRLKNASRK